MSSTGSHFGAHITGCTCHGLSQPGTGLNGLAAPVRSTSAEPAELLHHRVIHSSTKGKRCPGEARPATDEAGPLLHVGDEKWRHRKPTVKKRKRFGEGALATPDAAFRQDIFFICL